MPNIAKPEIEKLIFSKLKYEFLTHNIFLMFTTFSKNLLHGEMIGRCLFTRNFYTEELHYVESHNKEFFFFEEFLSKESYNKDFFNKEFPNNESHDKEFFLQGNFTFSQYGESNVFA
jgi:hypothetical protein